MYFQAFRGGGVCLQTENLHIPEFFFYFQLFILGFILENAAWVANIFLLYFCWGGSGFYHLFLIVALYSLIWLCSFINPGRHLWNNLQQFLNHLNCRSHPATTKKKQSKNLRIGCLPVDGVNLRVKGHQSHPCRKMCVNKLRWFGGFTDLFAVTDHEFNQLKNLNSK